MRLFLSFLGFCSLLFFGINDSVAGARQHANAYSIDQQLKASPSTQIRNQVSPAEIIVDDAFDCNEAFEDDEDEDDDQEETIEKSQMKHYASSSAFFLFSMNDTAFFVPTLAPFFAGQACPIYISQRVLRI